MKQGAPAVFAFDSVVVHAITGHVYNITGEIDGLLKQIRLSETRNCRVNAWNGKYLSAPLSLAISELLASNVRRTDLRICSWSVKEKTIYAGWLEQTWTKRYRSKRNVRHLFGRFRGRNEVMVCTNAAPEIRPWIQRSKHERRAFVYVRACVRGVIIVIVVTK